MFLTIIAKNQTFSVVLEKALSFLFEGVESYESFDLIPQEINSDITICVVDEDNYGRAKNWSRDHKTFALSKELEKEEAENFSIFLKMPIRLGMLIEIIRHHINFQEQQKKLKSLHIGSLKLVPKTNQLFSADKKDPVILTEKEKNILIALHKYAGEVVSRDYLLKNIWGYVDGLETHTLETHIYRLRQKIEKNPSVPEILLTEENGYKLNL